MYNLTRWFISLAVCLLAALAPAPATADDVAAPQTIYQSAEFGYLFWWDPGEWAVNSQSTEPGADWVSLIADGLSLSVYGYAAPGVAPEQCLEASLARSASAPGVIRLEAADGQGGPPKILSSANLTGNASAYVAYLLTFATDAGETHYRYEAQCLRLGGSDTLLWFAAGSVVGGSGLDVLGRTPARTLVLPMGEPDPDRRVVMTSPVGEAFSTAIQDQADRDTGILTVMPYASCTASTIFVVGEAIDAAGFVLDPARFALADGERPSRATWLSPGAGPGQSLLARPGQPVLLQLDFTDPAETVVVYMDDAGHAHAIDAAFTCGGGGGAMPIRVPLE